MSAGRLQLADRAIEENERLKRTIDELLAEIARLQRQLDRQHEGRSVRTTFADRLAWGRQQLREQPRVIGGPPWRVS